MYYVVDDGRNPTAREARVQRNDAAYHETYEFHDHIVPRVREVPHCIIRVSIRVVPVSSAAEAVLGVILLESMYSLIFRRSFPCSKHQVTNEDPAEKSLRNRDCVDVRESL